MAATRLKRKNRLNKTVSRQRKTLLKKNSKIATVKSPYKDKTGIISEE